MNVFKAEWVKENHSSNYKMLVCVPLFFILFCFLLTLLMGTSQTGKSNLIAAAFNWYPAMILPIVISLLVTNSFKKEKKQNKWLYQIQQISSGKLTLAKFSLTALELFVILVLSVLLLIICNSYYLHDTINYFSLMKATLVLFLGSLPILSFNFLFSKWNTTWLPLLTNLALGTFAAAIIAVKSYWYLFPWCYSLRMLAPILGIHPNGTFLTSDSFLWDEKVVIIGCLVSLFTTILFLLGTVLVKRGNQND